jgi:hypothetical protein
MLIILCGGNDIPTKQNGDLIFEIWQGLSNIEKNGVMPIILMQPRELENE